MKIPLPNFATNTTHLMWIGRWIEVRRVWDKRLGEWCWQFKRTRDAVDWLLWDDE